MESSDSDSLSDDFEQAFKKQKTTTATDELLSPDGKEDETEPVKSSEPGTEKQTERAKVKKKKLYKCHHCTAIFSVKSNCTRHEGHCSEQAADGFISQSSSSFSKTPKCKFCRKIFAQTRNVSRHEKHCVANPRQSSETFKCETCSKSFPRLDHLKNHKKKPCLVENVNTHQARSKCMYPECGEVFFHKSSLLDHIKQKHGSAYAEPAHIDFQSLNDFKMWKENEEEKNYSYFSMQSGESKEKRQVIYLYCQHDGSEKLHLKKGEGRKTTRVWKSGRVKRGCLCLAHMKVRRHGDGISVEYYPMHSHPLDPKDFQHQPLSSSTYETIDQQLAWDVSPTKIKKLLENGAFRRDNRGDENEFKKNEFVSVKLIRERKRRRRNAKRRDKEDADSVDKLYYELKEEAYNPVIVYKPSLMKVKEGPPEATDIAPDNLFMFGIQTEAQAQLFKSGCKKAIIVDETHGTNQYDFKLMTVMVPDENNRCWPAAHLITSRSDAATLKYFFLALKNRCPESDINCVMTDDDSAFINSIEMAYGKPIRHLLCLWHLHQTFQRKIPKHVSPTLQTELYNELKVIVGCPDEKTFHALCRAFVKKYSTSAPEFIKYFEDYYMDRPEKWAMCFRNFQHAKIETTGAVESFHNRLKKKYMKRKPNKRLDDLISMLFDIEEDDYASRKRERVFGVAGTSADAIYIRHKKALEIPNDSIEVYLPGTAFFFRSASDQDNIKYHIVKHFSSCFKKNCKDNCKEEECKGLCAHLYSCSCPDKSPLCKHIHKLHIYLLESGVVPLACAENEEDGDQDVQFFCNTEPTSEFVGERFKENRLKRFDENLQKLQELRDSGRLPDTLIAHADIVIGDLVKRIEKSIKSSEADEQQQRQALSKLVPTQTFVSTQKLVTQASQRLPSLKRPAARKKKKTTGLNQRLSPKSKETVKKNLLNELSESEFEPSFDAELEEHSVSFPSTSCYEENGVMIFSATDGFETEVVARADGSDQCGEMSACDSNNNADDALLFIIS